MKKPVHFANRLDLRRNHGLINIAGKSIAMDADVRGLLPETQNKHGNTGRGEMTNRLKKKGFADDKMV